MLVNVELPAGAVMLANCSDGVGLDVLGGDSPGEMGATWMVDALDGAFRAIGAFVEIF